jgi:hypothetical protein
VKAFTRWQHSIPALSDMFGLTSETAPSPSLYILFIRMGQNRPTRASIENESQTLTQYNLENPKTLKSTILLKQRQMDKPF